MRRLFAQPTLLVTLTLALAAAGNPTLSHGTEPQTLPANTGIHKTQTPTPPNAIGQPKPLPKSRLQPPADPKKNAPAAEAKKYYQVKPGETLYSVSVKTGQVFQNLAQWNSLPSPYQVKEGQVLKLFDPSAEEESKEEPQPPAVAEKKEVKPLPGKEKSDASPKNIVPAAKKSPAPPMAPPTIIKPAHPKVRPPITPSPNQGKGPVAIKEKTTVPIVGEKMLKLEPKALKKLSFKWPMNGPVVKNFAQSNNQGIDIENKIEKRPVLAAEAGRVVYTGQGLSSLKNLIIIQHTQQYLTAYANNSRVLVNEDQQVKAGQRIAELDASANKANTLHFEIRKNGTPVNPLTLLTKAP